MRAWIWVAAAVCLAVCLTAASWTCWTWMVTDGEWTTRSPAAREEFLAGFENRSRHYFYDAVVHFERALELDPEFAAAKLFLGGTLPHDYSEHRRLFEELRGADLGRLTERERFLVSHALARHDGHEERAAELRRSYLEAHPEDPYALREECYRRWETQSWDTAEECYRRLAELDPNRVEARDHLGYIALARGRFEEAEEHFIAYRYVAHDQATPYESMAQLLLLRGRYDEAEETIAEALRIKADFCSAYVLRARLESLRGAPGLGLAALDELAAVPTCAYYEELGRLCALRAWLKYQEGDPEAAWELVSGECLEHHDGFDATAYRIAVMTGRTAAAADMRRSLAAIRERAESLDKPAYAGYWAAMESYAAGVERLAADDAGGAAEHFRRADEGLGYWSGELASFKLFNRLHLLRMLEVLGRDREAAALRAEIEEINPRVIDGFPIPDLGDLGPVAARRAR